MRKNTFSERSADLGETFTIEDIRAESSMSDTALRKFLYRLEKQGWIERIERGKYMVLPIGASKGEYTINEFVIGSMLVEPHCIG